MARKKRYPGLNEYQRLAMTRAIFEEALRDMRRDIKDIVTSVLEQYGWRPPDLEPDR